jgi:hypothetical protein
MNRDALAGTVVRVIAAALVLVGGGIHLKLYNDGYKDFPNHNLGRSFLLNVIASVVVAVAIVVWRNPLALLAGILLLDGTLFAFGLARTSIGIFGFTETGFNPSPEAALAVIVEIAAAVLLIGLLAWQWRPTGTRRSAATAN